MILDAGVLISVDRSEQSARTFITVAARNDVDLHTTETVVAQVWRDGSRQARLASFLRAVRIHPLDDGRSVGRLLARSGSDDVIDAHLVLCAARTGHDILTSDAGDIQRLAEVFGSAAPAVHDWP